MADITERLADWPVPAIQDALAEIHRLRQQLEQLPALQSQIEALSIDLALLQAENVRLRWQINHKPEVMR